MSAGKGPGRRKGSDNTKYRNNLPNIKGMNNGPDIDKAAEEEFERTFMGKEASEKEDIPSGKYFIK